MQEGERQNQKQFVDNFIGQLREVCQGIEAWKSDDALMKRIDLLQELNRKIDDLNRTLGQREGEKLRLTEEVKSLEELRKKLVTTVDSLTKEVEAFHNENTITFT